MQVILNGQPTEIPDGLAISGLIEHLELSQRRVAVEVNRELIPRASHAEHQIAAGDQIELVTLVGGG